MSPLKPKELNMAATETSLRKSDLAEGKYLITNFVHVTLIMKDTFDFEKFFSMNDMAYKVINIKESAAKSAYCEKKIELTVMLWEGDIESLKDHASIEVRVIDQGSKMAVIKVTETLRVDYSTILRKHMNYFLPDVLMYPCQTYDVIDSHAHHQGHPCGYIFFVPFACITDFEKTIASDKFKSLFCKTETVISNIVESTTSPSFFAPIDESEIKKTDHSSSHVSTP